MIINYVAGKEKKKKIKKSVSLQLPFGLKGLYFKFQLFDTLFSPSSNCFMQRKPSQRGFKLIGRKTQPKASGVCWWMANN